ncbi:MAG: DUF2336 domain-containing protein [Alphaproteobacteria bacterium]|nr:DUF2336 domain-containing protein [Alphaproteobacteria bacterium]
MIEMSEAHVKQLMALAGDRSDVGRKQLAEAMADMFVGEAVVLSAREQELINEIIDELLANSKVPVRTGLSQKLATSNRVPRRLLMSLACDHIEVAQPVLENSSILSDEDLVYIVSSQPADHAKAVAHRKAVSEAVADALVVTGDVEVMTVLATNLGARISPKAMTVLAEAARFTAALREPVMQRPEVDKDTATKMYWWVGGEMRRFAMKKFGIQAGQIDGALEQTIDEMLGKHMLEKNDDEAMKQVADWLAEREAVNTKTLIQVLRIGHFRLFNILLARMTRLDIAVIDHVVIEQGGRSLAALCRAIGIDKPNFVSLFLISRGARPDDQVVHPRELSHALAAFDRISLQVSQQLLSAWQKDPSYLLRGAAAVQAVE